jgi:hypothetical protein
MRTNKTRAASYEHPFAGRHEDSPTSAEETPKAPLKKAMNSAIHTVKPSSPQPTSESARCA